MDLGSIIWIHDMITLAERSLSYAREFPNWPAPRTDDRWLDGVWVLGNDYTSSTGFYGSYPPNYIPRVMSLLPDITKSSRILHLFSGCLPKGNYTRVDCIQSADVRANAELLPFRDSVFDLILADPPYGEKHAKKYGTPMPNKREVFEEARRVLKIGGHMVWLDTKHPMYRKDIWDLWGLIGIVRSTNHDYRFASFWTRSS